MPYGYLGQNQPNQTVNNSGVFSITDVAELQSQGKLGGSLELIEEINPSSASSVEFTNIKENKFDVHFLNFYVETTGSPKVYLSNNGGTSYITSGYQEAAQINFVNGGTGEQKNTSQTYFQDIGYSAGTAIMKNGYGYYYNLGNSSKYSFNTYHTFSNHPTAFISFFGGGVHPTAETINAIKFSVPSGNFTGTIKLYGVKQI